jgi:RNA polymerase sigma factor (sigma-70 family)
MSIALSYTASSAASYQQEQDLVQACIRQERWAQQQLYETYYPIMMGVCLRYARDEERALDILQEGFLKVFSNITKYPQGAPLIAWIKRIMINSAIDQVRKEAVRRSEDLDGAYEISSLDADAISQYSEKEIMIAIQQLSPVYRAVFNLYAIEGYSHKEIGEQLHITESTSRANLVKARNRLQELLK